jgi:hypothetical protein
MFRISQLLQAARTWFSHRQGRKTPRRSAVAVEHLDHRRLLSINFTGTVATDFPATERPGVVVFDSSNTPNIQHPIIPPTLQPFIQVNGFDLSEIRVSYDSANDTLDIGFNQPPSGNPGQPGPVIAGDADDNGTAGTVNPAVEAAAPGFTEFPQMGGSDEMAAFLDFTGTGVPQIVAGYSPVAPAPTPTNPAPIKPYQVAMAIPNTSNPKGIPTFGTTLPNFIGNVYLVQTPAHPNLEFSIVHFSQLYQMETGKPLTSSSVVGIGGFAGSLDDIGISDAFFPENTFTLAQATVPTPTPTPCPPQSPTIYVNPHEHRIIDTVHRDLIRVTIVGTSGFNVKQINPTTVTLDGVHAIAHVTRKVRRDEFPIATYVFPADELHLPRGLTNVTLAGTLKNGTTTFQSSRAVLNIPDAARVFGQLKRHLGNRSIYPMLSKLEAEFPTTVPIRSSSGVAVATSANPAPHGLARLKVHYAPLVTASPPKAAARREAPRPVVSIPKRHAAGETTVKVPTRLRHSLHEYLAHADSRSSPATSLPSAL